MAEVSYEILELKRPRTVLEQYKSMAETTLNEWILVKDADSTITSIDLEETKQGYDFISFKCENPSDIYGRTHFGIGLYRANALERFFKEHRAVSEGLDLMLAKSLKTLDSETSKYLHHNKLTMKAFYRYGKGRAYYIKESESFELPRARLKLKYVKFYFAYTLGLIVGLWGELRDNNW